MVVAASTSEILVNLYQTTQHFNPEDSHRHTLCHESHILYKYLLYYFTVVIYMTCIAVILRHVLEDSMFSHIWVCILSVVRVHRVVKQE
jgi:hypothetical protein